MLARLCMIFSEKRMLIYIVAKIRAALQTGEIVQWEYFTSN